MTRKVKWTCTDCGQESIYWECSTYWDSEHQKFLIGGDLNDGAATFCGGCGGEDTGEKVDCQTPEQKEHEQQQFLIDHGKGE